MESKFSNPPKPSVLSPTFNRETMQPTGNEVSGHHYRPNTSLYSPHFTTTITQYPNMPPFQFNPYLINPHTTILPPTHQIQEFNPKSSPFSSSNNSSSTSDEAADHEEEQQHLSLIKERKQRRMLSNRESARRSRMRKQKQLDELWSQVVWLQNDNHQLLDKLNDFSETHGRVVQENTKLKEEATQLRQMLADMQLDASYLAFRDIEDFPCNTDLIN